MRSRLRNRLPSRDAVALTLLLALAIALPWLAEALGSPASIALATRIAIYAIAASALNLALGHGGMVSFGHAAFFGLGGYAVGILYAHWSWQEPLFGLIPGSVSLPVTLLAAIALGGVAAAVIGALSLRTSGVPFIMITLAFAQMIFFLFVSLKAYGGDDGLSVRRQGEFPGLSLRDPAQLYWLCLGLLVAWLALLRRVTRSRFGQVLDGARQSERRLRALGITPYPYKLVGFILSGMGTALAGALMVNQARFVSPDMMHWTKSGELMIMVILGGVGTLLGPVFGAAALVGLESLLSAWTEHWQIILGPILLLVVLFARGGLMALLRRALPA
ncbi:branched-chain amino acid ABC transporter permease [Pseudoroseomonas cervicalis]|uniref:branched-chain amino acid ABC transporter permease n=1 Tax=Teichococcus cervicalis TaxID=204525 RepID=UPI0022F1BF2E|nr:branched-chain amino acid ABC transporter permease [Pseudoroseomonas cervicalis]WBV43311.1 branched-chain amino acid ABC transporter permease [Pseudoroseomonas cervicalis]